MAFALVEAQAPFVYQQIAEKAYELSRLGMSANAIARALKVTDKTVTKALHWRENHRQKGR
jgi:DNA-binding MarR family transcriptional regulator